MIDGIEFHSGDGRRGRTTKVKSRTKYLGRRHGDHVTSSTNEYYVAEGEVLKGLSIIICDEGFADLEPVTSGACAKTVEEQRKGYLQSPNWQSILLATEGMVVQGFEATFFGVSIDPHLQLILELKLTIDIGPNDFPHHD